MKRIILLLVFTIFFALCSPANPANAQEEVTWEPVPTPGIYGERIEVFTPNPVIRNVIFLGSTNNGLYRSVDGGLNWQVVLSPEYLAPVTSIAIGPDDGRTIFASGKPGGVFRSNDMGLTWIKVGEETFNGVATAIGTNPFTGRYVYLASDSGFYRSSDFGETWENVGLTESLKYLFIHPDHAGIMFTSSATHNYRSSDYGSTWTVYDNSYGTIMIAAAYDPFNPDTITVTVKPTLDASEPWQFARISLKTTNTFPNGKKISDVAFSLAVKTKLNGSNLPSEVRQSTGFSTNRITLKDLKFTGPISKFNTTRYGLAPATTFTFDLAKDPTTSSPYDDLSQVWHSSTSCPTNQQRMVVEVLDTYAKDLDIYIGTGDTPSKATEVIASALPGAMEYINIINPTISGQCWILVQSFESSSSGATDSVQLAVGFVPKSVQGTFNVSGPATLPALTPFEIKINYGLVDFETNKNVWYGYLTLGSATGKTDDIGSMSINIYKVIFNKSIYLPMVLKR